MDLNQNIFIVFSVSTPILDLQMFWKRYIFIFRILQKSSMRSNTEIIYVAKLLPSFDPSSKTISAKKPKIVPTLHVKFF